MVKKQETKSKNKTNIYILIIVAIVAVVAIIVMTMGSNEATSEKSDVSGQAYINAWCRGDCSTRGLSGMDTEECVRYCVNPRAWNGG